MFSLTCSSQIWLKVLLFANLPIYLRKLEKKHLGANQTKDVLENVAQSHYLSRKKNKMRLPYLSNKLEHVAKA
jgi:hypothetical protein